ncbi:MAG: ferritin family protein [candidate division WS1 bacterium]|nr:ferritin family protein [candidate division WS1 bacterium]
MPEGGAFTAAEMVGIAVQLEQNGQIFYLEAAKRAVDEEAQRLLEWLAHEEQRHEEVFREMLPPEKEHRPAEEYAGQRSEYVQALLEERLLPSEKVIEQALSLASDQEILDFALGFEKDTILFYYELRHLMGEAQRPIMEDVLAQEKTHVERLRRLCRRCAR